MFFSAYTKQSKRETERGYAKGGTDEPRLSKSGRATLAVLNFQRIKEFVFAGVLRASLGAVQMEPRRWAEDVARTATSQVPPPLLQLRSAVVRQMVVFSEDNLRCN